MSLALCHTVPRDILIRLMIIVMVIAFVLVSLTVEINSSSGSLATLTGTPETLLTVDGRLIQNGVEICNAKRREGACDAFVTLCRISNIMIILGLCSIFIVVVVVFIFITPCTKRTTPMIIFVWVVVLFPTSLIITGVMIALVPVVAYGKALSDPRAIVTYGTYLRLGIAGMAMMIVAFILASIRLVLLIPRFFLKRNVFAQGDIVQVMNLHLVNDDWTRQKQMWELHSKEVHVEIARVAIQSTAGKSALEDHTFRSESVESDYKEVYISRQNSKVPKRGTSHTDEGIHVNHEPLE